MSHFLNGLDMSSNIALRRYMMAKNRRISDIEWLIYIENAYPEWYEEEYSNKWPISIIYYSAPDKIVNYLSAEVYTLRLNRYIQMKSLLRYFRRFLTSQKNAIYACFGDDIAEHIFKYIPSLTHPLPSLQSEFYIHKDYVYKNHKDTKFVYTHNHRVKIEDITTINRAFKEMSGNKDHNHKYLRLRNRPLRISTYL